MLKLNLISGTRIPRNLLFGIVAMVAIAAGMTIYVWKTRSASGTGESLTFQGPVAPPVSGPTEPVTLYVADDDAGILRAQPFKIPLPSGRQQRAEELLRDLVELLNTAKSSSHPIGPGSEDATSIWWIQGSRLSTSTVPSRRATDLECSSRS